MRSTHTHTEGVTTRGGRAIPVSLREMRSGMYGVWRLCACVLNFEFDFNLLHSGHLLRNSISIINYY